MYLKKSIVTGFGIEADTWAISKLEVVDGKANANLSLYASELAYQEGKSLLDNCRVSGIVVDLTSNIEPQIFEAVMASRLNDEGEEQNVYSTSHSGIVSFQDAQILGE